MEKWSFGTYVRTFPIREYGNGVFGAVGLIINILILEHDDH